MVQFSEILSSISNIILKIWWVPVPLILLFLIARIWLAHQREKFIKNIEWSLVSVTVPKEVEKTPKAMEQVFSALHAMYSFGIRPWDKWTEGKIEQWISFELVGEAKGINFYVRIPSKYRSLLESAIYSQYPDAEIEQVPESQDYVKRFPPDLPNDDFDVWGTEFVLAEDDPYPIRTYEYFEEIADERRLDPISSIAESMSKLKDYESIWLQVLIRPTGKDWVEEGEDLIEKIESGEEEDSSKDIFDEVVSWVEGFFIFIWQLLKAIIIHPEWSSDEDDSEKDDSDGSLNPVQKNKIKAIDNKISKIGFETTIRFVYIDKKDDFNGDHISSVMGSFRQFNTNNLNSIQPNISTMTIGKMPFKDWKILHKKRKIYSNYRTRRFPGIQPALHYEGDYSVFNTEELATIYHFPLTGVKLPQLRKTEFRKGGPPADLPTFEEGEES